MKKIRLQRRVEVERLWNKKYFNVIKIHIVVYFTE